MTNETTATMTRADRKAANKGAHAIARARQIAGWEAAKAARQAAKAERVASWRASRGMASTFIVAPAAPAPAAPEAAPVPPAPAAKPAKPAKPAKAAQPQAGGVDRALTFARTLSEAQRAAGGADSSVWHIRCGAQSMEIPGRLRGAYRTAQGRATHVCPAVVWVPPAQYWLNATLPEPFAAAWRPELHAERMALQAARDAELAAMRAKAVKRVARLGRLAKPVPVRAPAAPAMAGGRRGMPQTVHAAEG